MQINSGYGLVRLNNGTYSVRSFQHAETFHPVIGPVAEAESLYVKQMRICERFQCLPEKMVLWDVGLGAAANVLTVLEAIKGFPGQVDVISFDHSIEPLRFALSHAAELGYFKGWEDLTSQLLDTGEGVFKAESFHVRWSSRLGDFPTVIRHPQANTDIPAPHAILFDAFSPAKNPDMWTLPLFARIHSLLNPGRPCSLATYSRSTLLRVSLMLSGFFVGAGHATGEKEETTIAANALSLLSEPLDRRWLKRVRYSSSAEPLTQPVYRQLPLSAENWDRLQHHPQFA